MRNFDEAPFFGHLRMTRACDLPCVHCGACAVESRNPFALITEEGFHPLEEVRTFGLPLMVLPEAIPSSAPADTSCPGAKPKRITLDRSSF